MSRERMIKFLKDTKFIFRTNFAGNPENDRFHNSSRYGNILIPSEELAMELQEIGLNVKSTKPKEGEEEGFVPRYYIKTIINYDSEIAREDPPKIFLVSGDAEPRPLTAENVGMIDNIYVTNVNATIEIVYLKKYDRYTAYIRVMYVEQDVDEDPYADMYRRRTIGDEEDG